MSWLYFKDFLFCIPATAFFAFLFRVPRRAIALCAVLGGLGYLIYDCTAPLLASPVAGYFLGTLFMAICGEILARVMKMPATIFVIPAIIPLVPGVGMYNTMLYLIEGQGHQALETGTDTLLAIIAMAMALVLTSLPTKIVTDLARRKTKPEK